MTSPNPGSANKTGKSKMPAHIERLVVWFGCSVILALLPPLVVGSKAAFLSPATVLGGDSASKLTILLRAASEQGEILLIAGAIAAAIVGEMIGVRYEPVRVMKTIVAVFSLILFAGCAFFFPYAKAIAEQNVWVSMLVLITSVIVAGAGVVISSIDRENHA